MKKYFIVLFSVLFLSGTSAFADLVTFRVGYFIPRAQSDLWEIEFENMDFAKANFQDTNFGFAYEYFLSRQMSLVINIDGYTKQKLGFYKDFVGYSDPDGEWAYPHYYQGDYVPSHIFNVSITPLQASLKLAPLGRRGKFLPYIGGGVGIYLWNVKLQGDMIDFSDEWYDVTEGVTIYPIYLTDAREENKVKVGYHVFGGIMIPVAQRISLEAEFKYNKATGTFTDAFQGFDPFDLGGYTVSLGLNYWF